MQNRVKARHLIQDQVPSFVRDNYPEFQGFLRSYYESLEEPGGPSDILNNIDLIKSQSIHSDAMPPGNVTGMTEKERKKIEIWINMGAKINN